MHPNPAPRRRHDAEIKAKVLAACDKPGAAISAVASAHGLNVNLVRKWRHGRGLKRTRIAISSSAVPSAPVVLAAAVSAPPLLAADVKFQPIEMSRPDDASSAGTAGQTAAAAQGAATIDIELRRSAASPGVRWPVSATGDCAVWPRAGAVIRIDRLWRCTVPVDMRAGADRLLSAVVATVGAAHARHGYLFAKARATRVKLLVHDGLGVWRASRRLSAGRFEWPRCETASALLSVTQAQFDALVVGLPWRRLPEMSAITRA
jgi:transposase